VLISTSMKWSLRRIANLLLSLSFGTMIATGLLMGYGMIPGVRSSRGVEVLGWEYQDGRDLRGFLANVFFTLATLNLFLVWVWLIRCGARGGFLRLGAGLFVGAVIIATLLFLTPSYCSREI
jgi:hypothetical protein